MVRDLKNDAVFGTIFQLVFAGQLWRKLEGFFQELESVFQKAESYYGRSGRLLKFVKNAGLYVHKFMTSSGAYASSRASFSLGCSAVVEKVSANILFKSAYNNC